MEVKLNDYDDELNEEFAAKVSFEDDEAKPKGSEEALDNALERTWYTDTSVSNPHNVGSAMGTLANNNNNNCHRYHY